MTSSPVGAADRRGPLRAGDKVQLTDPKGRMHTILLTPGQEFHTHRGIIAHDDLIGRPEGIVVHNSGDIAYQALRPSYEDFVLSMPRGAAVVYPKDAALIVTLGDIYPGATVVEAGVGSGALTLALLRAVGDGGRLHSFERREEFAAIARGNVEDFFAGPHPAWDLTVGDLAAELPRAFGPGEVDRVVLDMLAPWECLDAVSTALAPGGTLIVYVATVPQLSRTAEAIRASGRYAQAHAFESTVRDWHLEGLAVRPEHRMIAHTGFLLTARLLAPGERPLERRKRPQGTEPSAADRAAWESGEVTERSLGQREPTPKKLRRAVRDAGRRGRHLGSGAPAGDPPAPGPGTAENTTGTNREEA
ncbi:tRNA (adenine-N1)-methyltransferase [Brevibacterium sp. 5221]|uniref:tRNA (Adenine-N1)-methyltransferase n=1 Tax=Brevibacterium rongguiense TaxID=2695267 RepID=A0A6N9H4R9_9MICO|nr:MULTISPECIES: tRNA (adenine-N1)-methyltransferase [Brevibacterium]MYM18935.1 tRNA (adenine-N1)-methyltransferase [Brevibacterium rongguiense]WAL40782.1 tRNA (adenine-N1)-methyltransferase [Brevibacterium sp. BRM-1]